MTKSPSYWLAEHVYVCAMNDGVVFLDLKRDKYFGFAADLASRLASVVHDWPIAATTGDIHAQTVDDQSANAIADELVTEGVLTRSAVRRSSFPPPNIEPGVPMIGVGADAEYRRRITINDVWNFLSACVHTSLALRFRPLEAVVARVIARKHRAAGYAATLNERTATELTDVFRRLRTFVFSGSGHCLFHALALTEFLSRYDVYPSWIIGVKTRPFGAHSWVQHDNLVLDGTPEQICFFTPIICI